ncbi:MAG: VOC family protein [Alphaproteobacteria bacterium]|nr:VOC family protein [Alphaproteobacteria bacterium]
MERVRGIGGIFFKARDPAALGAWYRDHLGVDVDPTWGGCAFTWRDHDTGSAPASTIWSPFKEDTTYFAPSTASFMVNFRVDDLDAMLAQLRAAGCDVDERVERSEFGAFGWVMDPEGNRVELWQPPEG